MSLPAVSFCSLQVLEFTEETQEFVFEGIKEPCVVSLFRDFSAPVKVVPWQDDEETAFLMAHDSDAFNCWQAANTLAYKLLLNRTRHLMMNKQTKEIPPLSDIYKSAFKTALIDANGDKNIKVRFFLVSPIQF